MAWQKKAYGQAEANKCYDMLARFKEQFKTAEQIARAQGKEEAEKKAHEKYNAMLAAMSVLVKEYDL